MNDIVSFIITTTPTNNIFTSIAFTWHDIAAILGWIFVGSGIIEITPIKINPLSFIFNWIGNRLNQDVKKQISDLSDKVDKLGHKVNNLEVQDVELKEELARREAMRARRNILSMGDEIKRHVKHSEKYFEQIIDDIDVYNNYCNEHPKFKNGITTNAEDIIMNAYKKCLEENTFL